MQCSLASHVVFLDFHGHVAGDLNGSTYLFALLRGARGGGVGGRTLGRGVVGRVGLAFKMDQVQASRVHTEASSLLSVMDVARMRAAMKG